MGSVLDKRQLFVEDDPNETFSTVSFYAIALEIPAYLVLDCVCREMGCPRWLIPSSLDMVGRWLLPRSEEDEARLATSKISSGKASGKPFTAYTLTNTSG